jgi:fibronectin type 3 domain-containing protein
VSGGRRLNKASTHAVRQLRQRAGRGFTVIESPSPATAIGGLKVLPRHEPPHRWQPTASNDNAYRRISTMQIQAALTPQHALAGRTMTRFRWRLFSLWIAGLLIMLLTACGSGGSSSETAPAPAMPTGIVVTPGNNEATVTWNAVAGATSYNIYRTTSQGQQGTKVGASSSTSYVDATAVNGVTYYYDVTADNVAGEGPVSAQSTGITPVIPATAPEAPSGLTVVAGNAQVTVNWTTVTGARSYTVYRSTTPGSQGAKIGSSSTTTFSDTTVANGTAYFYAVTADNAAGEGPASVQSRGATPTVPAVAPAAPTGVNGTAGNGQVTVRWTSVAGATSYDVYRSTAPGSQGAKVGSSSTTAFNDTAVVNGTAYFYAVTADNAAGEGPASVQSPGVTPAVPVAAPAAPTGVNVTAANAKVTVTWTASAGSTSYNLYRSTVQGTRGSKVGSSSTTSFTDGTAANGATYYYEVTAANAAGESQASTQSAPATPAVPAPSGPAAALAKRLGLPNRLLIGLGSGGADTSLITTQGLKPDFYERYLVGIDSQGGWTTWNSPSGAYARFVMSDADSVGAVPMFTLFQFSADNLSDMTSLASASYMQSYWADLITLFNQMNQFGKPAVLSVEPDFWGFAQSVTNNTYGGDPTKVPAVLSTDAACAGLPANLTSYAPCLLKLARKYAPKAAIGFPPSDWGGSSLASVVAFMNQLGTAQGDFIVMQTLDRDAGCPEQAALTPSTAQADCVRGQGSWYWDETNQTHPNFQDNFAMASTFHTGIGGLPIIWWQTPFGVPSATAGGTAGHFRDNRVDYFLKHPSELVAVGGLGVVFGAGAENQTTPATDGGQFQTLSARYLASPAALP